MNYENPAEFSTIFNLAISLLRERGMANVCNLLKDANFRINNKEDGTWFGGGEITYIVLINVAIKQYSSYSKEQINQFENMISDSLNEVTKIDESSAFITKIYPLLEKANIKTNDSSEKKELRQNIDTIRNIMVSVATGGERIQNENDRYQQLHRTVKTECDKLNIPYNNSFSSLWDWYGKWKADFKTYNERREFIRILFAPTFSYFDEQKNRGVDVIVQLDDWIRIKRTVSKIETSSKTAQNEEDFQTIGLLCRDVIISLAQAVYNPTIHGDKDDDGITIGNSDAVRMIGNYIKVKLSGKQNKELRDYAKATNAIANQLTHKRTATKIDMLLTMSATISLINFIGILEDKL